MASISAITSGTTSAAHRMPPPSAKGQDPMAAVAEKLGLSSDDLKAQLRDGKSLDDVATAQGVSHDELITAIKAGLPAGKAGDAEKIASSKGTPPPPPPPSASPGKLDRLGDLLDMDADEVESQATSASDLVKLLQSKGVDLTALCDTLNNGDLLDVAA